MMNRVSTTKRIFLVILMTSAGFFFARCTKKRANSSGSMLSIETVENESRDYVRNAVSEPVSSEQVELANLFSDGTLEYASVSETFSVSNSEYSSIMALRMQNFASENTEEKPMRMETIRVNRALPLTTLRAAGRSIGVQLSLTTKSQVKIYRMFKSQYEEQSTPRFEFLDLPVNLENAEKMRSGDLVVIPVDGQMMTSVDGSFFRRSRAIERTIDSFLGSSLIGQAQTGLRANLIVNGRFEIHIMKTDSNSIRVRFFQQNEKAFSTAAVAQVSTAAQMKIVPFSKLHQLKELIKVSEFKLSPNQRLQLPQPLEKLLGKSVLREKKYFSDEAESSSFTEEMKKRPDGLVELSLRVERSPLQIQNQTISRVESMLSQVNPRLNVKLRKTAEAVKVYSDQEIRFDAGISWTEKLTNRQRFYSDYIFDLRDEPAREAFLQAVSGAAVVISSRLETLSVFDKSKPLHNLVLAERMALEQAGKPQASVVRVLSASSRAQLNEGQFQIQFGRQLSFSLSESWMRERYSLVRQAGASSADGYITRWSFRQASFFGMVSERRDRSSGFVSDVLPQSGAQPIYWYAQETESRSVGQSHLEQFWTQAHNILGPVAASLELDRYFAGEAEGRFRGRIVLGFSPGLLDLVFDPAIVTEDRVWRIVAAVAETFDNKFGLPFLVIPAGIPAGVYGTSNESACQTIAYNWGSFYCHYVAQEFIPKLRAAQAKQTTDAKGQFLEAFFAKGFGANKIGSDLLARVLLQLAVDARGQLSDSDLVVLLEGRHSGSSASGFNPRIIYGNSQLLEWLEQSLPGW